MALDEKKLNHISRSMQYVSDDMEADVNRYSGAPLTGKTVGEIHGNLAAAVQAVALAVKSMADHELKG